MSNTSNVVCAIEASKIFSTLTDQQADAMLTAVTEIASAMRKIQASVGESKTLDRTDLAVAVMIAAENFKTDKASRRRKEFSHIL